MFDRLPFIVHRIEAVHGIQKQSEIAGRFMRQAAAEAFIQNEVFKFETRGSDAGALWGRYSDGPAPGFGLRSTRTPRLSSTRACDELYISRAS